MTSLDFDLFYRQLYVFDSGLVDPFNDWRPSHVSQGFSYRKQSVAFSVFEDEDYHVNVHTEGFDRLPEDSLYAAQLPLTTASGRICVGGISDAEVSFTGGLLWTVIFVERPGRVVDLFITPSDISIEAKILKEHHSRPLVSPLVLDADPAW